MRTDISVQYILGNSHSEEWETGRNGLCPEHGLEATAPVSGLNERGVLLLGGSPDRRTDIYLSSENTVGDMLPDKIISTREAVKLLPPICKETMTRAWKDALVIGAYLLRKKYYAEDVLEGDVSDTSWYYLRLNLLGQPAGLIENTLRKQGPYDPEKGLYGVENAGPVYGPDEEGIVFRGWWYGPEFLENCSEETRAEYKEFAK